MRYAIRQRLPAAPLLATILLLASLLGVGVAYAHPEILSIEPPPDARLEQAPAQVVMRFNEPIEPLSRLELFSARGVSLAVGGERPADDPASIMLALPPLEPGLYTVVWTVAGSDGHVIRGNFAFTVLGSPAAAPAAAEAQATPAPVATPAPAAAPAPELATPTSPAPFLAAQTMIRWALLFGATGAVGAWSFWLWVLLPALAELRGTPSTAALRRWRLWTAGLLLLVLLGAPLLLAQYVIELTGAITPAGLLAALASTRQGQQLAVRAVLAVCLLALTVTLPDGDRTFRQRAPIALLMGGGLLLTHAVSGHAAAAASPLLPIVLTWLHLAATSLWAGGLLIFAVGLGTLEAAGRAPLIRALLRRFSPLAIGSVVILALSGTAAALRELQAPADLWRTAYGRALLAKLLLFGGMLILGAYHQQAARRRRGGSKPATPRLRASLRVEAGLALLVLLAAGALTSLPPPASAPATAMAAGGRPTPTAIRIPTVTPGPTRTPVPSRPFAATQPAGDLQVSLAVEPARLGENRFRVGVTDSAGDPVETQLVRLSLSMLEMDMGVNVFQAEPLDAAQYEVEAGQFSMVGDWQVKVLVRRATAPDVEAVFTVPVGE